MEEEHPTAIPALYPHIPPQPTPQGEEEFLVLTVGTMNLFSVNHAPRILILILLTKAL